MNIDWSFTLRLRQSWLGRTSARLLLQGDRRQRFDSLDADLMVHDLRTGIPFPDGTVDAVYHSHVLEHLDRKDVPDFFAEILRVLRPNGVHRLVVPDLEQVVHEYVSTFDDPSGHDQAVARLYEQSVRREAFGTSQQGRIRRRVENAILGDARKRGETHQWMWDRVNLREALEDAGFTNICRVDATTSAIPTWQEINLDWTDTGVDKPGSLYMEADKPAAR